MRLRIFAAGVALLQAMACNTNGAPGSARATTTVEDSLRTQLAALKAAAEKRVADSIAAERSRPRSVELVSGFVAVPPSGGVTGGFRAYGFVLPTGGTCTLEGRVEVTEGGQRDLAVAVFGNDDFTNWKNNVSGRGQAMFSAPPQTVTNVHVAIGAPGTYWLVLSNRFSSWTSKGASAKANVTCIGSPQPVLIG